MKTVTHIVHGGGWRRPRAVSLRVKAWAALFFAVVLGGAALVSREAVSHHVWVPVAAGLVTAMVLFVLERPVEIGRVARRVGRDPRKLYVKGRIR